MLKAHCMGETSMKKRMVGAFVGATALVGVLGVTPAGATPPKTPTFTVVADNLNSPRQIVTYGKDVAVAEAGTGGDTCLDDTTCIGFTGSVTAVLNGVASRVQTGLLSIATTNPAGEAEVVGLDALALRNGSELYGVVTGTCDLPPGLPPEVLAQVGKVVRLSGGTDVTTVADVSSIECTTDPDGQGPDTDPYGIAVRSNGTIFVADAAGNDVLKVRNGETTVATLLASAQNPGQPVPTSLAIGPDGALYIGTLNFEAGPGGANVYRLAPGSDTATVYASGLSAITGLAFGPHGKLYVSEFTTAFGEEGPTPDGAVVQIPVGRRHGRPQDPGYRTAALPRWRRRHVRGRLRVQLEHRGRRSVHTWPSRPAGEDLRLLTLGSRGASNQAPRTATRRPRSLVRSRPVVSLGAVSVAASPLFAFDNSYVRDAAAACTSRWQAAAAPAPRLLALNDALAAELGLDPDALRSARGRRRPRRQRRARRGRAGGAGLRRPPVRRVLAPPRRRPRPAARRDHRHPRPPPRPPPEGLRGARRSRAAATARPPSARCCASTSSARRCTPSASPPPGRWPSSPPASDVARETMLPGAVLARVAASHLRVGTFQYAAAADDPTLAAAPRRLRHRPPLSRTPPRPTTRTSRCFDAVARRPGVAGGAVDARRLRPRRDEHRQHDDLRRDDRLRPVRVHGRLRSRHRLQLDRPRRPLRLRQPAADRPVEPGPAGRDAAAADRRRPRRRRAPSATEVLQTFPDRYARLLGRRDAGQARPGRRRTRRRRADRRPAGAAARPAGRLHRRLARAVGASCAATRSPRARCSPSPPPSTPGRAAGGPGSPARRVDPQVVADAMDGVNPVYIPRNHLVEEALTAATAGDLAPFHRLVDVLARPFDERPGLEAYAAPAPDGLRARTAPSAAPERPEPGPGWRALYRTAADRRRVVAQRARMAAAAIVPTAPKSMRAGSWRVAPYHPKQAGLHKRHGPRGGGDAGGRGGAERGPQRRRALHPVGHAEEEPEAGEATHDRDQTEHDGPDGRRRRRPGRSEPGAHHHDGQGHVGPTRADGRRPRRPELSLGGVGEPRRLGGCAEGDRRQREAGGVAVAMQAPQLRKAPDDGERGGPPHGHFGRDHRGYTRMSGTRFGPGDDARSGVTPERCGGGRR